MKKDAIDYLNSELNNFQKASELQFSHFMGVFYFWTLVVSAPVTAGLLTSSDKNADYRLGILLLLTAILGFFLSAKMFDIRCSQLKYIAEINQIRGILHKDIKNEKDKKDDPLSDYKTLFPSNVNLRKVALKDFGRTMAITMSALEAVIFGFALPLLPIPWLQGKYAFNYCGAIIFFIIGVAIYYRFILSRVPEPPTEK